MSISLGLNRRMKNIVVTEPAIYFNVIKQI